MTERYGLCHVALPDLRALLAAIHGGIIPWPATRTQLSANGFGPLADALIEAMGQLSSDAALQALNLVIAERVHRPGANLELVWTGPDVRGAATRDTAVVVRELFSRAERHVLIAGFSFDHGENIFQALHEAMTSRCVRVEVCLDLGGRAPSEAQAQTHAVDRLSVFLSRNWPFGPPFPTLYYDPRTVAPDAIASLHAKCVVVDERYALVTSANFTDRGQTRNIEAGVLVDDVSFARQLSAQWRALISAGLLKHASQA